MAKLRLGVLASGSGSNLQAILDNIDSGKLAAEVVVVGSDKVDAYALQRAEAKGIPTFTFTTLSDRAEYEQIIVAEFRRRQVDLVILAGYMRLVGTTLLEAYPQRIMNIHPALLPAFPGTHAQRDALGYGVKFSGCTVHFVDAGMDSGPIIKQAVVPVFDHDDVESLKNRILVEEHRIYSDAIKLYGEGRLKLVGRQVVEVPKDED